jgi:glycerol kinase
MRGIRMNKYILSLDQGTTACRSVIFDLNGRFVAISKKEFRQIYPKPGWVEHDPMEILETQLETVREAVKSAGIEFDQIMSIGITNQRETTIVWDKDTGKPVYNAIVWQCRRTADICRQMLASGMEEYIRNNTGLVIDAYFSATKLKWILDNVPGAREKALSGKLLFGTVDTWLLWNLSSGKCHMTDYSNASRTMMYNIKKLQWDKDILKELDIPESMLPSVHPSSYAYGSTKKELFGVFIPIGGIAGDQQAALFGQTCFCEGEIKNTYGTGCFILMNTGKKPVVSQNGLITTLCATDGEIQYALEGSIFTAGSVIKWLRDRLGIISTAEESEKMAKEVKDTNGVVFVPTFVGLGTPYWDMGARGTIVGITEGVNKNHIVRAALESIAWQSVDVIRLMEKEAGVQIPKLRVDGGASANDFLMQFQADTASVTVERPLIRETTALGAAYLAGLSAGAYDKDKICTAWEADAVFTPKRSRLEVEREYVQWKKAVSRATGWC